MNKKEIEHFIDMFELSVSLSQFKTEYILKLKEIIEKELKKRGV